MNEQDNVVLMSDRQSGSSSPIVLQLNQGGITVRHLFGKFPFLQTALHK